MTFAEKLTQKMTDLRITQKQLCDMTNLSASSVSKYLSGSQKPSEERMRMIARSMNLDESFFIEDQESQIPEIDRITVEDAAKALHLTASAIREGLKQGVFPWGYAIKMNGRYVYWINRQRFLQTEGV